LSLPCGGLGTAQGKVDRKAAIGITVALIIYEMFLGHGIHCTQSFFVHYRPKNPYYWYAWNLEDPYARGYDAIRRLFLIEVAKQAKNISAYAP
jgi:hypothetical protein